MKKVICLVLAAAMIAALFCVPALAEDNTADLIKILMSTDKVTTRKDTGAITAEDMRAAIDAAAEAGDVIPTGWYLNPARMTVFQQRSISCKLEVYDVTFKFWSTLYNPVCIFFRAEGSDVWELLSCEMGDVAEARFNGNGSYAITMCW